MSRSIRRRRRHDSRPASAVAVFETLPARRLLSSALSGSQLIILGTEHRDHVYVSVDPLEPRRIMVNVNGDVQRYNRADVSSLSAELGAGSDFFVVDESYGDVTINMSIHGGGGADLIIAGSGNDTIYGGGGRDRIDAGAGNDLVFGGAGRDQIAGGDGHDTLLGGSGDDALDGGAGDDVLSGGSGDDYLVGGLGADVLIGGGDNDVLLGGQGNDSLCGGRGDDDLDGGPGDDDLSGGAGNDAFARTDNPNDLLSDLTPGEDRAYVALTLDFVPEAYQNLFAEVLPDSEILGVRVNDDRTFDVVYRFNPGGEHYRATFSFAGDLPFENLHAVEMVSQEVPVATLPELSLAAFRQQHPDAVVKQVVANHATNSARVRYKDEDGESKWTTVEWMENG